MFSPTGTTFHCPKMSFERVPNPFQTHENFICERRIRLSIRVWSCLFVCQYQGALLPSVVLIEDEKNRSMFFLSLINCHLYFQSCMTTLPRMILNALKRMIIDWICRDNRRFQFSNGETFFFVDRYQTRYSLLFSFSRL